MSYCRMENTYNEMVPCVHALEDGEELSESEYRYAKKLIDLAGVLAELVPVQERCEDCGSVYEGDLCKCEA